jgi:hypothetical protein
MSEPRPVSTQQHRHRERCRAGQDVPRHLRNPTKSEIEAYRGRAERILEQYGERAIEDAKPGIVQAAQGAAKGEIIAEIKNRTGLWPAIGRAWWCGWSRSF